MIRFFTSSGATLAALSVGCVAFGQAVRPLAPPATPRVTPPAVAAPAETRDAVRGVRDPVQDARDAARNTAREARQASRAADLNFRAADLGLWLSTRPGANGVVVADVANQGAIASVGFREGDRIVSINGQAVTSESAFLQALNN